MKIAIISPWTVSNTAVGGTERFVLDLARAFKLLGNEVDVYMLSGKDHITDGINFINLKILDKDDYMDEYKLEKLFGDFSKEDTYNRIAKTLEKLVDGSKYDMIHLNSQLFLKAWSNNNRIFTIHTNPFEYKLSFGEDSFECMLQIMKNESKNKNTYFIAPSEHYAKVYNELTNLEIKSIPHAIDLTRLKCNKSRKEICDNLMLDESLKIILLPSRLEPIQKQPMLFMKAFSKMDENIKSKFQVICTGLDKQYMEYVEEIASYCEQENINLKIMRFDTMSDAYAVADIVALPSQSESFGYAALESLSLGIPTILNAIPTFLEIVRNSNNSYVFNNTVDTLFDALNKVIETDLNRVIQTKEWQSQYDLKLFGKRYIDILK